MFQFGANDYANMAGVHPRLIEHAECVAAHSPVPLTVLPGGGMRDEKQIQANVAAGTGIALSLHRKQRDGYSWAIDLVALKDGKPSWDVRLYRSIRPVGLEAAARIGILIQHGADWDLDNIPAEPGEWDWPHWQFPVLPARIKQAQLNLDIMRRALGLPLVKGFVP